MKVQDVAEDVPQKGHAISVNQYLDIVCQNLPVVNRIIDRYGDVTLSEYLREIVPNAEPSYQQWDDLLEAVYRYAAPLLGKSVAQQAARDLASHPVVLTTNHHGVDYFSQSIQGTIIFSLKTIIRATSAATIPIFSCGSIPLDNPTYPQGLLLYRMNSNDLGTIPKKLPVFSNQFRRWLVSIAPAFDQTMIGKAETSFDQMVRDGIISSELSSTVHKIFREDYCADSVLTMPSYSQQAVVLNNRIWKRVFSKLPIVPDIVCLELENLVSTLLQSDLLNPESLAWSVMFDPTLREYILEELDGVRGCWEREKLVQRLAMNHGDEAQQKAVEKCGTIFFWGIDYSGRKIPLYLEVDVSNKGILRGINNHGLSWEIPYTPRVILYGLRENKLLPSLFTSFLVLSFARGLACVGGCLQGEYLPAMQRGVVTALRKAAHYHNVVPFVSPVPTSYYLDCMVAIMGKTETGYLIPAGPIEIIAGGGITGNDIEQILLLTVREAHLSALFETDMNFVLSTSPPLDWKKQLSAELSRVLASKIVVK